MLADTVRIGLRRGWIECRHSLPLVLNYVFFPSLALVIMYFLRGIELDGTGTSLGNYAIPGILAMNVLFTGLMGLATNLIAEREDGTLLRARSIPLGIHAYLLAKVTSQIALTVLTLAVVLIEAALLFGGFASANVEGLVTLAWILPLGLTATLPFGAVLGCLVRHPRNMSFVSLALMGLVSVSGIFYPLSAQAWWMQLIGQSSPLYWLALAIRGALLGDDAVAMDVGGGSPIPLATLVLVVWSVVGTSLAIAVLRRGSRGASGSRIRTRQTRTATP